MRFVPVKVDIVVLVSAFLLFDVRGALAFNSNSGAKVDTVDSSSSIAGKSWTDLGAEQFAALSSGTQIVNCTPSQKLMQPGVVSTPAAGSPQLDPGFHFLSDGRCALDLNALPTPVRSDGANGGAADISTKAFDLQWFGTGLDGGPAIGGSTCFVGDALNNHCGIETNISIGPRMMATGGSLPPIPSTR